MLSLKIEDMKKAAIALLPCISKDSLRYALNGLCMEVLEDEIILVACDGHK